MYMGEAVNVLHGGKNIFNGVYGGSCKCSVKRTL